MAKQKQQDREHALLSASSSHKWLYCTPSARLEADLPDTTSGAAKEGTLAHNICELKLQKLFTDQNMTVRTYNSRMKKLQENEKYAPEMERHTDTYVDYIKELAFQMPSAPTVMIEHRADYSAYAQEGFGTADCILLQGVDLHVIDFKYGQGVPVSAEGNSQLALYALGILDEFGFIYPIENVHLHIVQPRLNSITRWDTVKKELLDWGNLFVKPRAELAYKGEGEFRQGDYCDKCFCKIAGTCRCRAESNMELMKVAADAEGKPVSVKALAATLSNEEIGGILKQAQYLQGWVKKLEGYVLDTLVSGGEIPGWKLVEGRSNRAFSDTDALAAALIKAGYDEAVIYKDRPLETLTELEKLVTKEDWNDVVVPFVIKPPGKPTIAQSEDKRPEYKLQTSASEAFGGDNQYKEEK